MRKALKIKASFLLISWFVIFMHGVIPHMHSDHAALDIHTEKGSVHLSCIHSDKTNSDGSDQYLYWRSTHDHNSKVCHFNPNLFPQLNLDYSFIYTPICSFLFSDVIANIQRPDTQSRYKKPPLLAKNSLRGPPLV